MSTRRAGGARAGGSPGTSRAGNGRSAAVAFMQRWQCCSLIVCWVRRLPDLLSRLVHLRVCQKISDVSSRPRQERRKKIPASERPGSGDAVRKQHLVAPRWVDAQAGCGAVSHDVIILPDPTGIRSGFVEPWQGPKAGDEIRTHDIHVGNVLRQQGLTARDARRVNPEPLLSPNRQFSAA